MNDKDLKYNTVTPTLRCVLMRLMHIPEFLPFRLVGGTSLSLRYGHRMSDDIDLFTDAEYGTINFHRLQKILRQEFIYCYGDCGKLAGLGASYIIGNSPNDSVKLDLFYTDSFVRPAEDRSGIRLASVEDIIAMKIDVISRGGRKKDFWDLHMLHSVYSIEQMLTLYEERYPYGATQEECIMGLKNFTAADADSNPKCLQNKVWQLIKLDFAEWVG